MKVFEWKRTFEVIQPNKTNLRNANARSPLLTFNFEVQKPLCDLVKTVFEREKNP